MHKIKFRMSVDATIEWIDVSRSRRPPGESYFTSDVPVPPVVKR